MSKIIDFKQGLTFYTTHKKSIFFKEVKKVLKQLGVKFLDNCCFEPDAVNVTADLTADQILNGYITSTSGAAVTMTLPTATDLAADLGAVQGSIFEFTIDNSAGANTVTLAVNTGITVGTQAITGGNTLTVSVANAIGTFRLIFTSTTTAILRRIV